MHPSIRRIAVAAAIVAGASAAATAPPVQAGALVGSNQVTVTTSVRGPDAATVLAGLTFELYDVEGTLIDPLDCGTAIPDLSGLPFNATETGPCTPGFGTFSVGVGGVPAGWDLSATCTSGDFIIGEQIVDPTVEFTLSPNQFPATCTVDVYTPILLLDKVVVGGADGALPSSDFDLEVYDAQGALVLQGNDVANATCDQSYDPTECVALALPSGVGYALGEVPMADYVVTDVVCDQYINAERPPNSQLTERIDLATAVFDHDDGDTYCMIENTYVAPTTTTSTTTTTTTTIAPTTTSTIAPTTTVRATTTSSIDAAGITLPRTGSSSDSTGIMAITALVLVAAGSLLLLARRRTA